MPKLPIFESTGYEGLVVAHLREELGMSVKDFADKLNRSHGYMRVIEKGKLTWPVFRDLIFVLKLSPWIFFYASEKRSHYADVKLSQFSKNLIKSKFSHELPFREAIGLAFKFLRQMMNCSIDEFSSMIGITVKHIVKAESGCGRLTLGMIQEVCARCNLPLWYFLLVADRCHERDNVSLKSLGNAISGIAALQASALAVLDQVAKGTR